MALPKTAYPGLVLGSTAQYTPGPGTHVYNEQVCASLVGAVTLAQVPQGSDASTVTVTRPASQSIASRAITGASALPTVGATVLVRVTRLQARQVAVAILVVEDAVCADAFQGLIRKEDVRGWEVDKVVMGEAFRVGDVVRAVVISLGDQAAYYLSTARNELGVLLAASEPDGNPMYPISWQEFKDPVTGRTELRKVAKPI